MRLFHTRDALITGHDKWSIRVAALLRLGLKFRQDCVERHELVVRQYGKSWRRFVEDLLGPSRERSALVGHRHHFGPTIFGVFVAHHETPRFEVINDHRHVRRINTQQRGEFAHGERALRDSSQRSDSSKTQVEGVAHFSATLVIQYECR